MFACGPWLGTLFPDVVGGRIRPSRQESFYFGTPAGYSRWLPPQMPVWLDYRAHLYYGIPGNANRGFKVAIDTYGPTFDPTNGDRAHTPEMLAEARAFLRLRLPGHRRCPAARLRGVPVRADVRLALPHRPPPWRAQRLAGGRGSGGTGSRWAPPSASTCRHWSSRTEPARGRLQAGPALAAGRHSALALLHHTPDLDEAMSPRWQRDPSTG